MLRAVRRFFSKDWRASGARSSSPCERAASPDGWSIYWDMPLWNPWARAFGGWKPYRSFLPVYWWSYQISMSGGYSRKLLRVLWIVHWQRTTRLSPIS